MGLLLSIDIYTNPKGENQLIKKGAMTYDHCTYLIGYNLINRRVSSNIIFFNKLMIEWGY